MGQELRLGDVDIRCRPLSHYRPLVAIFIVRYKPPTNSELADANCIPGWPMEAKRNSHP